MIKSLQLYNCNNLDSGNMCELIAFLCGMAVMVLELAGVRIISPYLGSTHVVYTSVIGIIMASLSIGYWLGGKLSAKTPSCLKLSAFITIAGIYICTLALFQFDFLKVLIAWRMSFMLKSVICAIIMFTIPSILLGIVSPYIIQVVLNKKQTDVPGKIVGKFYAISTIGSILGTFLCGFYLIVSFGIDRIFFALSFVLFICSIICLIADINVIKVEERENNE